MMQYTNRRSRRFASMFICSIFVLFQLMICFNVDVSYAVDGVTFTVSPAYSSSALLPQIVTVTADKSAFTVGSAFPALISAGGESQSLSIIESSATELKFSIPSGVANGTYELRIGDPAGDKGTGQKYYLAGNFIISTPSITTATPFASIAKTYTTQQEVTITGQYTNFSLGKTTVELLQSSTVKDTASVTAVAAGASNTQTLTFKVSTGLASGDYDVRITTDKEVLSVTGGIKVRSTSSITLDTTTLSAGYSLTAINITGTDTGFNSSTQVKILDKDSTATGKAGDPAVTTTTAIALNISTGLTAGTYTVQVKTDTEEATATLTVSDPTGEIKKQSDSSVITQIGKFYAAQNLKIVGSNSNFSTNTTLTVFKGETQLTGVTEQISGTPTISGQEISFTLKAWSDTVGTGDLTIKASTGGETVTTTLKVVDPSIALGFNTTAVSGTALASGYKGFTLDVNGTDTHFTSSTTVAVFDATPTDTTKASGVSYTSATKVSATLAEGLTTGTYTVKVDVDGSATTTTDVITTTFTVADAAAISNISPKSVMRTGAAAETITVVGTNTHFSSGTPTIDIVGVTGETIQNVTVISDTTLKFELIPNTITTNGSYTISVVTNSSAIEETATKATALTATNNGITLDTSIYYTLELGNKSLVVNAEGFTFGDTIVLKVGGTEVASSAYTKTTTKVTYTLPKTLTAGILDVTIDNNNDATVDYETSISVVDSAPTSYTPAYKVYGYTDTSLVIQGNTTLTFKTAAKPTVKVGTQDVAAENVTVDETNNKLTIALPTGISASKPAIAITWASGDYDTNTLTLTDYEIKNEISDLQLWFSDALAGDKAVYLNYSGTAIAYKAIGTIVNGTASNDKTSTATWASSDTSVATISAGTITIVGAGETTISAVYDGQTDSIKFTVFGPSSIDLTDSKSTIKLAEDIQLTATATYGDASTQVVTTKAVWSVNDTTVIAVSGTSKGLVTGLKAGQATVTATYGGKTGTYPIVVTSIDLSPSIVQSLEAGVKVVRIDGIDTSIGLSKITVSVGGTSVTPVIDGGYFKFTVPTGVSTGAVVVNITADGTDYVSGLTVSSSTATLSQPLLTLGYSAFNMVVSTANIDLDDTTNKPTVTVGTTTITAGDITVDESADTLTFAFPTALNAAAYNVTLTWVTGSKYEGHTLQKQVLVAETISFDAAGSSSLNVGSAITLVLNAFDGTNTVNIGSSAGWTSSNTAVATVSNGVVSALSSGTTTITGTYQDQTVTKLIIVNDTSGSTSTGEDTGGETSTGGITVPIIPSDETVALADEILENLENASTDEAKSDVVTLAVNTAEALTDTKITEAQAETLSLRVFESVDILLGKAELVHKDAADAATDTTKVVESLIQRADIDPEKALIWTNKILDETISKTMNLVEEDTKLTSNMAEDVLDRVVERTIEAGISTTSAKNLFEKFITDTAAPIFAKDTEAIASSDLKDKLSGIAEAVIEKAGNIESRNLNVATDADKTVVTIDKIDIDAAAAKAIAMQKEMNLMLNINKLGDVASEVKAAINIEIPEELQNKEEVKFEIETETLQSLSKLGVDITLNTKGIEFKIPSELVSGDQAKMSVEVVNKTVAKIKEDLFKEKSVDATGNVITSVGKFYDLEVNIRQTDSAGSTATTANITNKPKITFPLADVDLTTVNLEKIGIYVYDDSSENWEFVKSELNPIKKVLTFEPPHFSIYTIMEYKKTFDDIEKHWAKDTIEIMASKHVTKGLTETTYGPDQKITRAQFATLLANALDLSGEGYNWFTDVKPGDWYYESVGLAAKYKITSGVGNSKFAPNDNITREQMAVMVANAYKVLKGRDIKGQEAKFNDLDAISSWALNAVSASQFNDIITGFGDNTFKPKNNATRAEGIVMLKRLMDQ